jgi:Immunoglobulin domain
MSRLLKLLLASATALAAATAWGAVAINDLQVTNVGTTTFTVVWTTSEVSTPGLEVYSDSAGTNSVSASLGLEYYPIAEADVSVQNDSGARSSRRALELLAINRRVISVRVLGAAPGTSYYVRPRTFGANGADNGTGPVALRQVTTAQVTGFLSDARLLRIRFPGVAVEGMVALMEGPAGTAGLSAIVGDSTAADSVVFPLANLLDSATGTNPLYSTPQPVSVRVVGAGAPAGSFPYTIDFGSTFRASKLDAFDAVVATPAPLFITHPLSQAEQVGATVSFTAVAVGTPPPGYKWQRRPQATGIWSDLTADSTYTGVTTGTLQIASVTSLMSGDQFRSVATNGVLPDATSNVATLTVTSGPANFAPSIITQPVNTTSNAGGSATLTVVAAGFPLPTYQWRREGVPLVDATSATLILTNLQPSDAGNYSVSVSNIVGSIVSADAELTVTITGSGPVIQSQPANQLANAGQSVTFAVVATGGGTLGYQWRKNGVNIPGANAASLVLTNVQSADLGSYSVVIGNGIESVTSDEALLSVIPAGLAATHAVVGAGYLAGSTVQITATITLAGTPSSFEYQALLPPGLSYLSGGGTEGNVKPAAGTVDLLKWVWTTVPASPVTFTYTLQVANGTTGPLNLSGMITTQPGPVLLLAQPGPLVIDQVTHHSADTNRDFRLSLVELLRVIELYNTRNGTVRTGAYSVDAGNLEDGFTTDPARTNAAVVALGRYHASDINRDGKLSLTELLRVIELYNFRSGTVRTGQYRVQAGTEDGFGTGP